MSRIKVDRITDKAGTGAPILVNGMNVTGKSTMGDIVGAAVTFNSITGGSANFSSDVSIGGTLTYEDVKNVDSVGLITARSGINITGGDLNAASNLILKVDGTERVRTTTAGNFGINDNNPANQLVVKAPGGSGHCAAKVLSGDTSTALFLQSIQGSEGRLGVESNHPLALYAGTAERLRIGTAGQLGINGANYGTSGQVLTSGGASAVVQWATPSGTETLLSTTSMNNKSSSTPIEFTSLDFTTYPRGFKFITSPWTVKDSGGSWLNSGHNQMRIVVGNSGGYIAGSNYAYHIMEQRTNTQNLELSATAGTDEISQGISIAKAQYFEFELHAADVSPGDTDASPAGITNSFSSKLKYRIHNGTDYNDMYTRWLEGAIVLNTNTDEQATKIKFYPGSSGLFNGGTMRAYGLK